MIKMRGMFSGKNRDQVESEFYHGQNTGIVSPPFARVLAAQNLAKH